MTFPIKSKKKNSEYNMKKIFSLSEIDVGLYVGMAPGKKDKSWNRSLTKDLAMIKSLGIDVIICLVEYKEMNKLKMKDYEKLSKNMGIRFHHVPVKDESIPSENIFSEYDKMAISTLKYLSNGKNVLVHCRCGMGRSSTFAFCCGIRAGLYDIVLKKCIPRIKSPIQRNFIKYYRNRLAQC